VSSTPTGLLLSTPTPVERTVTYQEIQRPFTLNPFQRVRTTVP
jgi:hypothetical protein